MFGKSKKKIHPEDEDFINDSKAALLDKVTPLAHFILYSLLIFLFIFLVWANYAEVDEITIGEGKIIPSSHVKTIESLDGGMLQDIPVKEGDTVKKGQVLVILDATRFKADYEQNLQKYYALTATIARLKAETGKQKNIIFPKELLAFPALIGREFKLFKAHTESLESQIIVLQKSYDLANNEVEIMQPLLAKGYAPKIDLIRAQRTANDLKGKIQEIQDNFYTKSWEDLNSSETELASLIELLTSLKDKMDDTVITSPVNGVIKKINIVTTGGVVSPGFDIMQIVPLNDNLLIEAQIKPTDIAFVHPGQPVTIKLTAYDYTIYGSLYGEVKSISADTIENEGAQNKGENNQGNYQVIVKAKKNYLGSEHHQLQIIPGMLVTVHILTGKKTVMQYLLKPLIKAKEEALTER